MKLSPQELGALRSIAEKGGSIGISTVLTLLDHIRELSIDKSQLSCYAPIGPVPDKISMRNTRLWWEGTETYWELPFYSEMGYDCTAMAADRNIVGRCEGRDHFLAGREQLWAIREGLA